MGKKSKKKRGAGAEAGDSNTLSEKVTELKELRGAQKGLGGWMEDFPEIVAQVQTMCSAHLPELIKMLGAQPTPGEAVAAAAEGAGGGSGCGPIDVGGGGKDRFDPYGK